MSKPLKFEEALAIMRSGGEVRNLNEIPECSYKFNEFGVVTRFHNGAAMPACNISGYELSKGEWAEVPKPMNFIEALAKLRAGFSVRRASCHREDFRMFFGSSILMWQNDDMEYPEKMEFHMNMCEATDWVIWRDYP